MTWIFQDPKNRKTHFDKFLPHIRFPQMLKDFLIHIVPHMATHFEEPIKARILEARTMAMECLVGGPQRFIWKFPQYSKVLSHRTTLQDHHLLFTIKYTFKNVNQWDINGKYYSELVFAHAYEFSFFLLAQNPEVENPNSTEKILAGFLQCKTSSWMTGRHFLPIHVTVSILLRGNEERRFTPSQIDFIEPEIDGKLIIPDKIGQQLFLGEVIL